jgi:hypothetical protein
MPFLHIIDNVQRTSEPIKEISAWSLINSQINVNPASELVKFFHSLTTKQFMTKLICDAISVPVAKPAAIHMWTKVHILCL